MVQGEPLNHSKCIFSNIREKLFTLFTKYRIIPKIKIGGKDMEYKNLLGLPCSNKIPSWSWKCFLLLSFLRTFFLTGKSGDFQDKWVIYMLFHSATTSLFSIKKCNFIVENPLRFLSTMAQRLSLKKGKCYRKQSLLQQDKVPNIKMCHSLKLG